MKHEIINLKDYYPLHTDASIEVEIIENSIEFETPRKAIIIVPGGGYDHLSKREADPVALNFMLENYAVFILKYTVNQSYPIQIKELACAFDYIRNNATKYQIIKDKIVLCGFSAGGHLCATYSYLYKNKDIYLPLNLVSSNLIPNALILAYPVITMGSFSHKGSKKIVTGNNENLIDLLSVEKHIDSSFPPTFVFHTITDKSVPIENSKLLIDALKRNHVRHSYRFYNNLNHGISISTSLVNKIESKNKKDYLNAHKWLKTAYSFLDKLWS